MITSPRKKLARCSKKINIRTKGGNARDLRQVRHRVKFDDAEYIPNNRDNSDHRVVEKPKEPRQARPKKQRISSKQRPQIKSTKKKKNRGTITHQVLNQKSGQQQARTSTGSAAHHRQKSP